MNDQIKQEVEQKSSASPRGVRGPSYPAVTLEQAIERAQVFYGHERRNSAPTSAAAKHWGYSESSSSWRIVLSALIQFGLMEDHGSSANRFVKLTELALDVLLDSPDSPKRLDAIRIAVRLPKLYGEILNKWSADELPSDQTLKYFLLREKGFNAGSVDSFIKDFRVSIFFAKLDKPSIIHSSIPTTATLDNGKNEATITDQKEVPALGDLVQWESGGRLMFALPAKVIGSSPDGAFLFVEGSPTGIPIEEVTVIQQATVTAGTSAAPPQRDQNNFPSMPANLQLTRPAMGIKQDTFSLDEGQIVLQWPAQMSESSYEDFKDWVELQLRKIKRSVQ